jgi:RNA polymerase sigma-70 factor (ECF subfamily)
MKGAMLNRDQTESGAMGDRVAEQALIQRAQRREPAAMRQLIDLHKDRLFAFVWRMIRNHHDTEEICQEAFLKAFAALERFDPTYRFSTWLFTIAYRVTLNTTRKRQAVSGDVDLSVFADDAESAVEQAVNSEDAQRLRSQVWGAVEKLTPPQRAAMLLFYRHQQSCQEIAAILDIPVATVKSHLHRARTRLRDLLAPLVAEDSAGDGILGDRIRNNRIRNDRIRGDLAG